MMNKGFEGNRVEFACQLLFPVLVTLPRSDVTLGAKLCSKRVGTVAPARPVLCSRP